MVTLFLFASKEILVLFLSFWQFSYFYHIYWIWKKVNHRKITSNIICWAHIPHLNLHFTLHREKLSLLKFPESVINSRSFACLVWWDSHCESFYKNTPGQAKILPFFLEAPDILLSGFKHIVFRFHNLQGKFYLPVSIWIYWGLKKLNNFSRNEKAGSGETECNSKTVSITHTQLEVKHI